MDNHKNTKVSKRVTGLKYVKIRKYDILRRLFSKKKVINISKNCYRCNFKTCIYISKQTTKFITIKKETLSKLDI
jgi:hypothetical protein